MHMKRVMVMMADITWFVKPHLVKSFFGQVKHH